MQQAPAALLEQTLNLSAKAFMLSDGSRLKLASALTVASVAGRLRLWFRYLQGGLFGFFLKFSVVLPYRIG